MKRGLFYLIRIFLSLFEIRKHCAFQPCRPLRNGVGRTPCERNVRVPTLFPELLLSSYHIKLRWKMMKPNIKVERISLLLARIHRKMENYLVISAEIWLLPNDLRHLSVNSPNHHKPETRLSPCFLTNCSVSMIRGLLCYLTLLKGRVFPVVSQSTRGLISKSRTEWPLKMFTCKLGRTVAITQKTFSANFLYQQMNKRLLQLLQVSDF